jgi:quercetin dioxygenase-like cupin family protein
MTMSETISSAIHRDDDALPWANTGTGVGLKVLQVRRAEGVWVIRNRFEPGVEVATHRHTGPVFAYTTQGAWGYRESDFLNTAGSYLFEPAGSVHSLYVPESNTEITDVFFVIHGANLDLDAEGNVVNVTDCDSILAGYLAMCNAAGTPDPPVIVE